MSSTTEEVNHQKGVNEQTGANHQTGVNEQTEMVMETSNQTGTGVNEQTEVVMQETSNQIGVDGQTEVVMGETSKHMASTQHEEEVIKKKYGGIVPKKPPLISKDHERAYFDSADWALGKQGKDKPKGPLEALRPKLQPTQQQTRYRKSPYAPSEGEDGDTARPEDATTNE